MTRHSVISGFFLFLPWKPPNFASLAWVNLLGPSSCGCTIVLYFSLLCFHTCLFFLLTDCLVFQLCAFLSSCFFVAFFFFHSVSLLHVLLLLMQLRLLVQTLSAKESNVGGTAGLLLLSSFCVSAKLCKSERAAHERSGETRLPEERSGSWRIVNNTVHFVLLAIKRCCWAIWPLNYFLILHTKGSRQSHHNFWQWNDATWRPTQSKPISKHVAEGSAASGDASGDAAEGDASRCSTFSFSLWSLGSLWSLCLSFSVSLIFSVPFSASARSRAWKASMAWGERNSKRRLKEMWKKILVDLVNCHFFESRMSSLSSSLMDLLRSHAGSFTKGSSAICFSIHLSRS